MSMETESASSGSSGRKPVGVKVFFDHAYSQQCRILEDPREDPRCIRVPGDFGSAPSTEKEKKKKERKRAYQFDLPKDKASNPFSAPCSRWDDCHADNPNQCLLRQRDVTPSAPAAVQASYQHHSSQDVGPLMTQFSFPGITYKPS